jgi:hypothetical protein
MTADELIERMARAAEPAAHGPAWELAKEAQRRALAAIREALQEPTDAMIDAGDAALFNAGDGDLSYLHDQAASYIGPVWKAMLSASLLKGET